MVKKTLSQEDSVLFRKAIGKVKSVKNDTLLLTPREKPKPFPDAQIQPKKSSFDEAINTDIETLFQEDRISFVSPGLQKNVLKKLRKGYFNLGGSIDLHGFNSREANLQLSQFIQDSIESGHRCIHIIHGKGYRSPNNEPVLKNNINIWLRQYKEVQAFCSASQKNGGTGAVIVLLKLSEKYGEEG